MTSDSLPSSSGLPSLAPDIRLFGQVNELMLAEFFRQQAEAQPDKPLVLELSTTGGNADIGRRIALELTMWQQAGRDIFFFGKSYVFSAGITIMSAIPASRRFITRDCQFLIHERKLKKSLELNGALRACRSLVSDLLAEIEAGQQLERVGFADLVRGTSLTLEDIEQHVLTKDWYLMPDEALKTGLVDGVI
jgi:ATP-dependent protease ClpP protease subunit